MKRLIFVTACITVLAGASVASAGFSGDPCNLVTAAQMHSVHVARQKCIKTHSAAALGTSDIASWGKLGATPSSLQVVVIHSTNPAALAFVEQREHLGPKLAIGEWAEGDTQNGRTGASIAFVKHGYYVLIHAQTPAGKPLPSLAPAVALAKQLAAKF